MEERAQRQRDLEGLCNLKTDGFFQLRSRAHRLQKSALYVKRDDELGFGVSGSKLRKYASLLPVLKKQSKKVAVTGSFHSNHVLSLVQLLKQEGIAYKLFLQAPRSALKQGNAFFLSLLLKEGEALLFEDMPFSPPETWKDLREKECGEEFFWVPQGGCMEECLVGALTLSLDLLQNEKDLQTSFDHVFIDAGTGLGAAALVLGLGYLQKQTKVHVVQMAGTEGEFIQTIASFRGFLQKRLRLPLTPCSYVCHVPATAKSFGSHNASVFQTIKETAEKEGIFLDPLYTAKLFMTAQKVVEKQGLTGEILWVHSGGALSLAGFGNSPFF